MQHAGRESRFLLDLSTHLTAEAAIPATPIVQLASRARVSDARAWMQRCKGTCERATTATFTESVTVLFASDISTNGARLALWVRAAWVGTILADQGPIRFIETPILNHLLRESV